MIPSSTAALVAASASSIRSFASFISVSVAAPTRITATPGVGFDALTENYVDMVENGILDPAKVTRSALQNATSVASTLLTTESVVANIKEETPAMPAGGAGMGMM